MRRKMLLALLLPFFAISTFAQFRATIQGTVLDPKENAVVAAKVTVTDEATGVAHVTMSNGQGFYRVGELAPGSYSITVEAAGFKVSTTKNITAEEEQPRGVDVKLEVGTVNEQVNVSATNTGLQTEDASISTTITRQEI